MRELTGDKLRHWAEFGSSFFLHKNRPFDLENNIFLLYKMNYSRLDKLSPDDATLPPVSCRTPDDIRERERGKHIWYKFSL